MFREVGFGLCMWDILSMITVVLMIGLLIGHRINDLKRNRKSENRLKKSDDMKS